MPELETLFVRIDADLSDFRRGLREAGRETRTFANQANRTFADVGSALDLSEFRQELAESERAAKRSADRMKKAFAEVGQAQQHTAEQFCKRFSEQMGGLTIIISPNAPRGSGESSSASDSPGSGSSGFANATGLGGLTASLLASARVPLTPKTLLIIGAASALGFVIEDISKLFSDGSAGGGSDRIRDLNDDIAIVQNKLEELSGPKAREMGLVDDLKITLERVLEKLTTERDTLLAILGMANNEFLVELQRLFGDAASQNQEFLTAFTELSDCLRQLCARIDELAPVPSGGRSQEGALSGGAGDDLVFGGAGGDSLFGGAGLREFQRQTIEAGGPLDDLTTGFVELTQAAGGFEALGGSLAERLIRSNALLGEQSGLLGQLTAQAPELGRAFATLFEEGAEDGRALNDVIERLGGTLIDAFQGAAFEGKSFREVLKGIIDDILVISQLPGQGGGGSLFGDLLGGLLGGLAGGGGGVAAAPTNIGFGVFAKGAAFAPGLPPPKRSSGFAPAGSVMARNIKAFARGGIVDTPEAFAFAEGLGIMGEAGPEAILPLARARSGELGVRAVLGRLPEAGGSAPAAAGPTVIINAPGADRDGMREVMDFIRFVHGEVVRLDRSIEPRSLRAWANHRRRGGFR